MASYITILIPGLISLLLLFLSPPDKFTNSHGKWYNKYTWKAWTVGLLTILATVFALIKQSSDDKELSQRQKQIDKLELNDSTIRIQLKYFGFQFDSNSNRIMRKIDSSIKPTSSKIIQRPLLDICSTGIRVDSANSISVNVNIPYLIWSSGINQYFYSP